MNIKAQTVKMEVECDTENTQHSNQGENGFRGAATFYQPFKSCITFPPTYKSALRKYDLLTENFLFSFLFFR